MTLVGEKLEIYAAEHTGAVPPLLDELRAVTYAEVSEPHMVVDQVEGQLLRLLVSLVGARRVFEVGMFTGYSALMMASALPPDGRLVTCEIDPRVEAIARGFFSRSPHGSKIDVRMGDAKETARTVEGPLDLVFLDADKESYSFYFESVVDKIRPGGLLVADNVLWSGRVVDATNHEASTQSLRAFNRLLREDPRVDPVVLTVRDGITVARRL